MVLFKKHFIKYNSDCPAAILCQYSVKSPSRWSQLPDCFPLFCAAEAAMPHQQQFNHITNHKCTVLLSVGVNSCKNVSLQRLCCELE